MKHIRTKILLAAFALAVVSAYAEPVPPSRVVFLVPVPNAAPVNDDLFLVTVPAAAMAGNGEPVVCTVEPRSPWRPELLDYLRRYQPDRIIWVGPNPSAKTPDGLKIEVMAADTAGDAACKMAASFWGKSTGGVVYSTEDRGAALSASVLAARMGVPLFPWSEGPLSAKTRKCLAELGVSKLLAVGAPGFIPPAKISVQHLRNPLEVAASLAKWRKAVDYLAVVHPQDGSLPDTPRNALAAVLLAVGRGGIVVPLPFDTIWKKQFPTGGTAKTAMPGVAPSTAGYRTGKVDLGKESCRFVTGQNTGNGRWWIQFDLDGDGKLAGNDEKPLYTGGIASIGGTRYAVNVDHHEKKRGEVLRLTSPTPRQIIELLDRYRKAIRAYPRYLCLVGWPEAVPLVNAGDGLSSDGDLVTDHPYAQTDEDPFVDMALARFIGEDLASATLLACRSLTFDDFPNREWAGKYATAEGRKFQMESPELAGMHHAGYHKRGIPPITANSPMTEVGVFLHGSHCTWRELGGTYKWNSEVLLSPCLVDSYGCSTAALDRDQERRSVAARMLRNGAVAFFGNARRGKAEQSLHRSELWNALLDGQSLGEAHRTAYNRCMVALLDKQQKRGLYRYQYDQVTVYGDPALTFDFKKPLATDTARVQVSGFLATLTFPSKLARVEYTPSAEWKSIHPRLYNWAVLGTGKETRWNHKEKFNEMDFLVTAEVRSRQRYVGVKPTKEVAKPLGWTGKSYVDRHADGTQSLYWRCRMIEFDQTTGKINKQIASLGFRLLTK